MKRINVGETPTLLEGLRLGDGGRDEGVLDGVGVDAAP